MSRRNRLLIVRDAALWRRDLGEEALDCEAQLPVARRDCADVQRRQTTATAATRATVMAGSGSSIGTRPPLWSGSARTVDRDCESGTDLTHARLGHASQSAHEDGDRDALDRVEVHRGAKRHRVVTGFEHDLAREPSYGRRTWSHECAAMPWNDCVARQDDYRSTTDLGHLAPPHLPSSGDGGHDAATARRNEARSPHSSGSSSGCSS